MINVRSEGLVNNLSDFTYHILGCGAIGSSAALQLCRTGATNFALYDMDKVGIENIGVSQYELSDIGTSKTTALKDKLLALNNDCQIMELDQKFTRIMRYNDVNDIAILGFDNMEVRMEAVQSMYKYGSGPKILIDGRMGAEHYQQYSIVNTANNGDVVKSEYQNVWYSDADGSTEPCNMKATSYCSNMAGSFIVNTLRKILTNQPYEKELSFNFPTMSIEKSTCYNYQSVVN